MRYYANRLVAKPNASPFRPTNQVMRICAPTRRNNCITTSFLAKPLRVYNSCGAVDIGTRIAAIEIIAPTTIVFGHHEIAIDQVLSPSRRLFITRRGVFIDGKTYIVLFCSRM